MSALGDSGSEFAKARSSFLKVDGECQAKLGEHEELMRSGEYLKALSERHEKVTPILQQWTDAMRNTLVVLFDSGLSIREISWHQEYFRTMYDMIESLVRNQLIVRMPQDFFDILTDAHAEVYEEIKVVRRVTEEGVVVE